MSSVADHDPQTLATPESRDTNSLLDGLYRISCLVSQTENSNEALSAILDEVILQVGASSASIALINPDSGMLEIEVHRGLPLEGNQFDMPLSYGVTGWVARNGKPLLVPDVRADRRYVQIKSTIRSEMAAPMEIEGAIIGVLNVDSETADQFNEQDLKVLCLLAQEASRVLGRIWHLNQLTRKASHLESLVKVGQTLVSEIDFERILRRIVKEARSILECRLCAVYLIEPESGQLVLSTLAGDHGEIDYTETLNPDESSLGAAIHRRKQVEVRDLLQTETSHFRALIEREKLVSMLATPIIYDEVSIGVINVYTEKTHRFNDEEKRLLSVLASLGAVAIQNARLYQRVFQSEATLRNNERLTTLGLLAAEIAHEIRNPLTVIKLLTESLDLQFDEGDPRNRDFEVISEKLGHLEEIVTRVLNFGKSRESLHSRCSLMRIIEETLLLMRLKLSQQGIRLEYIPGPTQIQVQVHKGQIQQVLLNLMLNALQAMSSGGLIRIETRCNPSGREGYAEILLSDSGKGIPEAIQDKIFDSFLSQRENGTGLGLAIVKRILKSHEGDIELVQSNPQGTTFRFWLPLAN